MSGLETLKMNKINSTTKRTDSGAITILIMAFGAIFIILLGGLFGFVSLQLRQSVERAAWSEALHIAEAGIDYYNWCLNNEVEGSCAVEKDYYDANGNPVGGFSIEVDATISCGETTRRQIISTGWTDAFPDVKRKVSVLYGKMSVAKYAYILNDNVWIGQDHEIRGPYHSNGGIRMDGDNQSLVSSGQEEWICTSSFGCGPSSFQGQGWGLGQCGDPCHLEGKNCFCPGVFTTENGSEDLFTFPVPAFDFDGITIDLADMKDVAVSSGVYLPPSADLDEDGLGYHIKFLNSGNFEVWIITELSRTEAYSEEEDWHYDYFTISDEYLYNTYAPPSSCSVVFVEDDLWAEGTVKGKITVASANLIDTDVDTDVVLPGNIGYTTTNGADGLALTGERNVLIGPQSPNNMELRGIFIAQKGRFGRNHYENNDKDYLEINGSIISNGRVGTQWTSGSQVISGYRERETYFDANLIYGAPPFVPTLSSEFEMANWEEIPDSD